MLTIFTMYINIGNCIISTYYWAKLSKKFQRIHVIVKFPIKTKVCKLCKNINLGK